MPSISQIPNFPIKAIFLIHFIFSAFSMMGFWTSTAYVYYNLILLITLLWAIKDDQNGEPLQMAIAVNSISFVLDILLLVMGFPESERARERFSAALAILHLIVRPITTIYLTKILEERGGLPGIDNILPTHRSQSYEDIDRNTTPPTYPSNSGGYDISTAQKI